MSANRKAELSALLERVEKAEGPDRELDARLHAFADGRTVREYMHPTFGRQLLARNSRPPHDECWIDHPTASPRYTASIDAALALGNRVLPDHDWSLFIGNGEAIAGCQPASEDGCDISDCHAATPALAILVALLRAKISEAAHD